MLTLLYAPKTMQLDRPVIFLAGPIQGSDNWQARAEELISQTDPDLIIANPRRPEWGGEGFVYAEQVEWEARHLKAAGEGEKGGCILFWLTPETESQAGRSYAQTTRYELAEWITRHTFTGARVVVGIQEGFHGARYIKHRLKTSALDIALCETLEEAIISTLALTQQ